jgi:hypothetical protein
MKITNDSNREVIDLDKIVQDTLDKYEAAFFLQIEGQLFIYRPITRKEYRNIYKNQELSNYEKQDEICRTVLVYPLNYDFDECPAGIPNKLFDEILEKSCLDPESMYYLLNIERDEALQLGSEMACMIAEAFPAYTIDEIESWNNYKFMKIYAQAEWTLTNIRGLDFEIDIGEYLAEVAGIQEEEPSAPEPVSFVESQRPVQQDIPVQENNNGMSPEQMRAYKEFVRQHPEFANAMQYDAAFTGMETERADTVAPALRPGWYRNH